VINEVPDDDIAVITPPPVVIEIIPGEPLVQWPVPGVPVNVLVAPRPHNTRLPEIVGTTSVETVTLLLQPDGSV